MNYLVDLEDVLFNLNEFLKVDTLTGFPRYASHNLELYSLVVDQSLKFAQNVMAPLNVSGDREGCTLQNGKVTTPRGFKEAYVAYAENGYLGMDIPETYGGQALPITITLAANEFFMGANYSLSMYQALTRGSAHLIEVFGTKELGELFCPKMYQGQWAGTMCLTEPDAGSSLGEITSTAQPQDDGTYLIKGKKIFISGGDHDITDNIIHLVLARVQGDPKGTKGISLFAVPKVKVDAQGNLGASNDVNCIALEHKLGIKGQATCALNFGENNQCQGYLVGERCQGLNQMFQMMNEARIFVGLQGLAIPAASYLHALNYAKERQQRHKVIVEYPDVRRNLMLCKSTTEGMRALLYMAAYQNDLVLSSTDAAEKEKAENRLELLTPICKAYCSDQGFRVTETALQIFGGYGYTCDYPAEQYLRDTKISSIYEGTNGIQALDLIARKFPMKGGQLFQELYADISAFVEKHKNHKSLAGEMELLSKTLEQVGELAMTVAQWGMSGDFNRPQLIATPFLEICGDVIVSQLLLDQAVLAQEKIDAGQTKDFYTNKILTAQFFAQEKLPLALARASSLKSVSTVAMDVKL